MFVGNCNLQVKPMTVQAAQNWKAKRLKAEQGLQHNKASQDLNGQSLGTRWENKQPPP